MSDDEKDVELNEVDGEKSETSGSPSHDSDSKSASSAAVAKETLEDDRAHDLLANLLSEHGFCSVYVLGRMFCSILCAAIVVAAVFSAISLRITEVTTIGTLSATATTPWEFDVDGCSILFDSTLPDMADNEVRVTVQDHDRVKVTVPESSESSVLVTVRNEKEVWERHDNYRCSIQVKASEAPAGLIIRAGGFSTTSFTSPRPLTVTGGLLLVTSELARSGSNGGHLDFTVPSLSVSYVRGIVARGTVDLGSLTLTGSDNDADGLLIDGQFVVVYTQLVRSARIRLDSAPVELGGGSSGIADPSSGSNKAVAASASISNGRCVVALEAAAPSSPVYSLPTANLLPNQPASRSNSSGSSVVTSVSFFAAAQATHTGSGSGLGEANSPLVVVRTSGYISLAAAADSDTLAVAEPVQGLNGRQGADADSLRVRLSAHDRERVASLFDGSGEVGGPDVIYFNVRGMGSQRGVFSWNRVNIYVFLSPIYLYVSSATLLAPSVQSLSVTLVPSFCPLPSAISSSASASDASHLELGLQQPVVNAIREALPDENGETRGGTIIFESDNVESLPDGEGTVEVRQDLISGLFFVYSPSLWREARLFSLIVISLVLAVFCALVVMWLGLASLAEWRDKELGKWGEMHWNEEGWQKKKVEVIARAGPFFMMEFLIGFPGARRGNFSLILTSVLHTAFNVIVVAPLLAATALYDAASGAEVLPPIALIGYLIVGAFLVVSQIYLLFYYADVSWKLRRLYAWPWYVLLGIAAFGSLAYTSYLFFWTVLGALVKPNEILPYAGAGLVLVAHVSGTFVRIRRLQSKLDSSLNEFEAEARAPVTKAPTVQTATKGGKLSVSEGFRLLSHARILELSELSLRAQIVKELAVLIILILFFVFVLFGFTAFGDNSDSVAAISTAMVLLAGGGANLPLISKSAQTKKTAFESSVTEAASSQNKKSA